MIISVLGAQFPVSFDVQNNLNHILAISKLAKKNDLVIFPEGSVSGYDTNHSFLKKIDISAVKKGLETIRNEAIVSILRATKKVTGKLWISP